MNYTQHDYNSQQFKDNIICGLFGEDINDETLEYICSSAEKEYSLSQSNFEKTNTQINNYSKVRKNLFSQSCSIDTHTSSLFKINEGIPRQNITTTINNQDDILFLEESEDSFILSKAIKHRPGKYFGSGNSPKAKSKQVTETSRKRSPTKLSKYSPFKRKNVKNQNTIKNYFSVSKNNNISSRVYDSTIQPNKSDDLMQDTNKSIFKSCDLKNPKTVPFKLNIQGQELSGVIAVDQNSSISSMLGTLQSSTSTVCKQTSGLENMNVEVEIHELPQNILTPPTKRQKQEQSSGDQLSEIIIERLEDSIFEWSSSHQNSNLRTPQETQKQFPSPKKTTSKSSKQPFVDAYNKLVLHMLVESCPYYNNLLSSEEVSHIEAFNNLLYRNSAQRIYCRLLSRKFDWIRVSTMKYDNVTKDLSGDIEALENHGLVTTDLTHEKIDDLCTYLTLPDLKNLCQSLNINHIGNKAHIVENLIKRYKQKPICSYFSQGESSNRLIRDKVISTLGSCVKLTEEPRKTIFRCLLLFSYPHYRGLEKDRFKTQLELLKAFHDGEVRFHDYKIVQIDLFRTRDDFLQYEEAILLKSNLYEMIEVKSWDEAVNFILTAIEKYKEFVRQDAKMRWVNELPDYLRKYTAGGVYISAISKGIDILRKYEKYFNTAKESLRMLLDQNVFSTHRYGQWFEQLALVYQRNLKDNEEAAKIVFEGLKRNKLDAVSYYVLSTRASLLMGLKSKKISDYSKDKLKLAKKSQLEEPTSVTISEQVLESCRPGLKRVFVQDSEEGKILNSVEDVARSHFRKKGYTQGRHDEGATVKTLVLACFCDIIFVDLSNQNVRGLFLSNFQNAPLDWQSKGFFLRRKKLIEERLEEILKQDVNHLWAIISKYYEENGTKESVIQWNNIQESLPICKDLLECLGVNSFVAIARLLMTDYATYHSGFPDLTLWNPNNKKCLFVEVKSKNDTLSIKQKLWLHNLKQFGVPAAVCHVDSIGCKSKTDLPLDLNADWID